MVVKASGVPSQAGRYGAYLATEAREVDPTFEFELQGTAAKRMGLHGQTLTLEGFQNLADGFTPDRSTQLGRSHPHRQWGFELVMHVPSSVSKAGEVLDEQRWKAFLTAVEKASHDTMRYLEQHAAYTRVTENGVVRRERVDLIYTGVTHASNRNGEISPHRHVVIYSRGQKCNGDWAALENKHFFDMQQSAHSVFNQALAYHLSRDVGLKVVRDGDSIRTVGVDPAWAKTTRREDIRQEQQRTGRTDPKGATHATLETRKAKSHTPFQERRKQWKEQAHAAGRYAADLTNRSWAYCTEKVQQVRADRCYKIAAKSVRSETSTFPAHKVDAAASLAATGRNIPPEKLAVAGERFRARPTRYGLAEVQSHTNHVLPLYTFSWQLRREERLVSDLATLSKKKRCGLSEKQLSQSVCGRLATDGQLERVKRLTNPRGLVAGESHTLHDPALVLAVQAYREAHRPVLAVGSSPSSTSRLRIQLGVQTYSAHDLNEKLRPPSHLSCIKTGLLEGRGNPHERLALAEKLRRSRTRLPDGCVVVTDLGLDRTAELSALVKAVRESKGKLIVTGPASTEVQVRVESHVQQNQQQHQQQSSQPAQSQAQQQASSQSQSRGASR